MSAEQYRRVHIAADRRRPYTPVSRRAPKPRRLTLNARCAWMLVGIGGGVLLCWGLWGSILA